MATFLDETIEQAIDDLAKRAVAARKAREFQKRAFNFDPSQLIQLAKDHPQLTGAVGGAVGGGVLGGVTSMFRPKDERQTGSSILTGALAGAGAGLGGSYALPYLRGQQGGVMPGMDPSTQSQVDEQTKKLQELQEQHLKATPSIAGTFAKDSPLLGAAAGVEYGIGRNARKSVIGDLAPGKNSRVGSDALRQELQDYLGHVPEADKPGLLAHAQGQGPAPASLGRYTTQRTQSHHNAMQRYQQAMDDWKNLSLGHGQRPERPATPETIGQQELRNIMDEGRAARLAEHDMTPSLLHDMMTPRSLGLHGLGYLSLPLLHYYARRAMHGLESPTGEIQ